MWNLPNILTLLRIILIPVFVVVFYIDALWTPYAAAAVFGIAALTDWLDGYLARRWSQTSPLGAFLDPVADKLMVAVALIVLLQADPRILLALPVMVIIGREITVSALREWMAEVGARATVAVSQLGKVKTTVQMISITLLILRDSLLGFWVYPLGLMLVYIAAILTLWSMVVYLIAAWPSLSGQTAMNTRK
ncbi:CDP-diacylglycerol--glycerol-3-phosphate 3-phosphatidyltransferase [Chromatium okenii]|jgi:CDP-diacylglycerol--glycerol-3-phosphate 3-phosphatidyltransferase/cardiolipin synthase|uniref:CDP-diacylglycerol--glycerol-3-phosphate 3-phosphatidyltransferase n=1 Tax=Chromatium okenii TaxID=61644 RepID=UPI0026F1B03B|nr:CDP-diacylglycerol--glycerol-3-phosphate 3-phosphatidyltransferase [Chromatium okenii]MBV5308066.1 CDP-diacylglycerol--glycerol-3-phosphate 3-phosphatidyltransferase [Chromatium okenii]